MISYYSIGLFLFEQLTFITSSIILFRTYKQTRFLSHFLLGTSYLLWIFNSIGRFITSFFSENVIIFNNTRLISLIWIIVNCLLILGMIFVFYSFIYFKTNRLHPIINIVSFLGGALFLAFIIPDFTEIAYSEQLGAWSAKYNIWISVLVVPMLLFFIFSFILPIYTKLIRTTDKDIRKQLFVQIVGLIIVIVWAFFAGFTNNAVLRAVRPFLMAAGWFIWSLTLIMDPFNIMISNAKISQLLITTTSGLPIYYDDFTFDEKEVKNEISADLASGLISGVTQALEQIMERKSELNTVVYKDKVIGTTTIGYLQAYIFGERFDKALKTVLNVLLREIQDNPALALKITPNFVDLDGASGKILKLIIERNLKRILVI
ncbi:MAG: hypothetical protein K9W46_02320 [Candidatus Heimdallarchaeum endolithica]|uniref:Uncharacterized protein n=1 Tax=Candidatus Heimdallarchaeum endolithica TaxID=2876572 RepID=A0A9Y1BS93_9ARCH|nr:MAG: hypothetical protein K9W46_02320 [Candidatus Heimdallarchaeum endolithica]